MRLGMEEDLPQTLCARLINGGLQELPADPFGTVFLQHGQAADLSGWRQSRGSNRLAVGGFREEMRVPGVLGIEGHVLWNMLFPDEHLLPDKSQSGLVRVPIGLADANVTVHASFLPGSEAAGQ